jgi:hypothetical protein
VLPARAVLGRLSDALDPCGAAIPGTPSGSGKITLVLNRFPDAATGAATVTGLAATGKVITSAGVVLAATFAALAVLPLVVLAELAFGVLLDAFAVRLLLVPALAVDLGRVVVVARPSGGLALGIAAGRDPQDHVAVAGPAVRAPARDVCVARDVSADAGDEIGPFAQVLRVPLDRPGVGLGRLGGGLERVVVRAARVPEQAPSNVDSVGWQLPVPEGPRYAYPLRHTSSVRRASGRVKGRCRLSVAPLRGFRSVRDHHRWSQGGWGVPRKEKRRCLVSLPSGQ